MDLYAQELRVWKECAGYRESLGEGMGQGSGSGAGSGSGVEVVEIGESTVGCKVPGAFE